MNLWVQSMNDLLNFSFFDLLPPSLQDDPDIKIISMVIDEEFQKINELIKFTNPLYYIDEMPALVLDYLAWEFHVDYWEGDLSLITKRELIKNSIPDHRIKGTPAAVERMLSTVLGKSQLSEWFDYGGKPYFFKIGTSDSIQDGKSYDRIIRLVEATQNVRSLLEKITVITSQPFPLYWGGGTVDRGKMIVYPAALKDQRGDFELCFGGGTYIRDKMIVYPSKGENNG